MSRPLPGNHHRRALLALVLEGVDSFVDLIRLSGLSSSTVRSHMNRLRALCLVEWEHGKPNSIRPKVDEIPEGL